MYPHLHFFSQTTPCRFSLRFQGRPQAQRARKCASKNTLSPACSVPRKAQVTWNPIAPEESCLFHRSRRLVKTQDLKAQAGGLSVQALYYPTAALLDVKQPRRPVPSRKMEMRHRRGRTWLQPNPAGPCLILRGGAKVYVLMCAHACPHNGQEKMCL